MIESFTPHLSSEEPLYDFGMTESRTALLPSALGLARKKGIFRTTIACGFAFFRTYDGVPLQSRGSTVEHEDRFDSIEKEFGYSAQETQNMCVDQDLALLVPHGGLKLVNPDAGVDGKGLSLHGFQPFRTCSQSDHDIRWKGDEATQYRPT
jgi:hypothetical protein